VRCKPGAQQIRDLAAALGLIVPARIEGQLAKELPGIEHQLHRLGVEPVPSRSAIYCRAGGLFVNNVLGNCN
jgi:hypothetical protein